MYRSNNLYFISLYPKHYSYLTVCGTSKIISLTASKSLLLEKHPHTKKYMHLESDIHMKKGMLCQDCHTSNDLHGDGFLSGTTLAPVEIECQDCHGTTTKYPWELPLGYGDEFGKNLSKSPARGVTKTLADYLKFGTVYPPREGYLLSARGNPHGPSS